VLARQDGKRPDSLMLIQWQRRKPLTWNVTVDHTLVAYFAKINICNKKRVVSSVHIIHAFIQQSGRHIKT